MKQLQDIVEMFVEVDWCLLNKKYCFDLTILEFVRLKKHSKSSRLKSHCLGELFLTLILLGDLGTAPSLTLPHTE